MLEEAVAMRRMYDHPQPYAVKSRTILEYAQQCGCKVFIRLPA
jgi:hypothetical protein